MCWLLFLTGIVANIRDELAEREKKLLSEAALAHRIVQPALLDQTQRLAEHQDANIDRLECNRWSLYVSLSSGNLFLIDLGAHNTSNHITRTYAHNVHVVI